MNKFKNYLDLIKNKRLILSAVVLLAIAIVSLINVFFLAAPKLEVVSISAKEIKISWKDVKNAELYNIYRMDESNGEYKQITTVKENNFTDTYLRPESKYWYKISVIRNGEEGRLSTYVKATTKSLPPSPSEVSAEALDFDKAIVKWNIVKEAEKYYIYRADGDNKKYIQIAESITNTFNDSKLRSTTKYKYKITAVNKDGESSFSSAGETITKDKVNEIGNSGNNLMNEGLAAEQGDWIYFANKYGYNSIYKIRKDGTSLKKLYDGYISGINVVGDWVYFSNSYELSKIKTDGSGFVKISNDTIVDFFVTGDWIYYENDGIYKMKTDGSQKVKLFSDRISRFTMEGDWIYYCSIPDKNALYKIKTDGSSKTKLTEESCGPIIFSEGYIYYNNFSDEGKIYRMKPDGTERKIVLRSNVNMFNIVDNSIIYENWSYGGRLFKMDINSQNDVQLADTHYNHINIVDNYIFSYDFDTRNLRIFNLKDDNVDLSKAIPFVR